MAQQIKLKRSAVAGRVPTTSSLDLGEIAVNTADGKLYFQRGDSTIQSFFTTNAIITGSLQQSGSDSYFLSNVGIGTDSPVQPLHVAGNARVDGDFFIIESNPQIFLADTNHNSDYSINLNSGLFKITDTTNNATRITVNSSGNVGIGTTAPTSKLHVSGAADVLLIEGSGSTANTSLFAIDGNNGRLFEVSDDLSDSLFSVNTIAGLPIVEVFADNRVIMGAFNQNDFVISDSKVGIGTTSPAYKLDVSGSGNFTDGLTVTGSAQFLDGDSLLTIEDGGSLLTNVKSNYNNIVFKPNNNTALHLNLGGYVSVPKGLDIGSTLNNAATPDYTLQITADRPSGSLNVKDTLYVSGSNVGIGTTSPAYALDVNADNIRVGAHTIGIAGSATTSSLAIGQDALGSYSGSYSNTAIGWKALSLVTGGPNDAIGAEALRYSIGATYNTAIGLAAGYRSQGTQNTFIGQYSGPFYSDVTGGYNTFIGPLVGLFSSGSSQRNTGIGANALYSFTNANSNTALGSTAGFDLTTGGSNTFIGDAAGRGITTGTGNTVIGRISGLSSTLSGVVIIGDGNGNQRIYVDNGGNVGIGTTSPAEKLTVEGNISASGNLYLDGAIFDSSDTSGSSGQVLTSIAGGTAWEDIDTAVLDEVENIYATVKNVSGGTLYKGTPVHAVSGSSSGQVNPVIAASASDATTMPATFILNQDINDEAEGQAIIAGSITQVDTSLFNVGDIVYVGESGGYTNVKPTGSANLIQNLGVVTKVHASNGSGVIYGSGRSNDIPNLPVGKIWVGSDSYSVTSSLIHLDESNGKVGIGTTSPEEKLDVRGKVVVAPSETSPTLHGTADLEVYRSNASAKLMIHSDNDQSGTESALYFRNGNRDTVLRVPYSTVGLEIDVEAKQNAFTIENAGNVNIAENLTVGGDLTLTTGDIYTPTTTLDFFHPGNSAKAVRMKSLQVSTAYNGTIPDNGILFGTDTTLYRSAATTLRTNGNLVVDGIVTAQEFHTEFVSASIVYQSGSTKFGDTSDDKHEFTGSLEVSGSIESFGELTFTSTQANSINSIVNLTLNADSDSNSGDAYRNIIFSNRGTETARIDADGNVGVGTASPDTKLHVVTSGASKALNLYQASYQQFQFKYTDTYQSSFEFGSLGKLMYEGNGGHLILENKSTQAGSRIVFKASGSEYMRITHDGKVGIGTTSPAYKLTVAGDTYVFNSNLHLNNGYGIVNAGNISNKAGFPSIGNFAFENVNVGIGTTSPSTKLHVDGNIRVGDANDVIYSNRFTTLSNSNLLITANTGYDTTFTNGGSERMRITSAGNVGIGTTSPAQKLEVNGTIRTTSTFQFYNTGGSVYAAGGFDAEYYKFSTSGNERLRIDSSGNVGIGTTSPSASLSIGDGTTSGVNVYLNKKDNNAAGYYVVNEGNASGRTAFIRQTSGEGAEVGTSSTNNLSFLTNDTVRVHIDGDNNNGNVGIGTTSPIRLLHLSASDIGISPNVLIEQASTGNASLGFKLAGSTEFNMGIDNADGNKFKIHRNYPVGGSGNVLTIDGSNNVGIGTTSPSYLLDVSGSAHIDENLHIGNPSTLTLKQTTSALEVLASSQYQLLLRFSGNNNYMQLGAFSANYGSISYKGQNNLYLGANGQVGVGVLPTSTAHRFIVSGSANQWGVVSLRGMTDALSPPTYYYSAGNAHNFTRPILTGNNISIFDGTAAISESGYRIGNNDGILNIGHVKAGVTQDGTVFNISGSSVGIGTTTPETQLDITGDLTIGDKIYTRADGNRNTYIDSGQDLWRFYGGANELLELSWANGAIFNEGGGDRDFRVESDTNTHMLFVDASEDKVGIGTTTPESLLTVNGYIQVPNGRGITFTDIGDGNVNRVAIVASEDNDTMFFRTDNGVRMAIASTNLGIGTISPTEKLTVEGNISGSGNITINGNIYKAVESTYLGLYGGSDNTDSDGFIKIHGNANFWGRVQTNIGYSSTNSKAYWTLSNSIELMTLTGAGKLGIGTSTPTEALTVEGNISGSGNLVVEGSIEGASKSFNIPHPTQPGKKLIYGSLEGPEHGVYCRGKIEGNVIELPEEWTGLVDEDTITVQLTSIGSHQNLYVSDVKDNKVFIKNGNTFSSKIKAFYFIQAMRKDIDKLQTVR